MKAKLLFFTNIITILSFISCNTTDETIYNYESNHTEFLDLSFDVSCIDENNIAGNNTKGEDVHLSSTDGYGFNADVYIPQALSCRVYYNNELISYVNRNNPSSDMISTITCTTDENSLSHFKFNIRFPKTMDPSKIKLAFAGQSYDEGYSSPSSYEDPFDDDYSTECYLSNTYQPFPNNYFGIFQLADSNDWSSVKTTFTIKNIATQIIILTDEFTATTHTGTSCYLVMTASLDYTNSRDFSDFFGNYSNINTRFYAPTRYDKILYNYLDDKAEILLNSVELFEKKGYNVNSNHFTNQIHIDYDSYLNGIKLDANYAPIFNYKGESVLRLISSYFVFPQNFSNIRFTSDSRYLIKSDDANKQPKYIHIYGYDYYISK